MKFKIYIGILLSITLFSCTEKYDVDLVDGASNRLVVEGSITSEFKIHQVTLSRTGAYFRNEPAVRELNATVTITDGDTVINLFDEQNDGVYLTDKEIAGKPGNTYTLNVTLSNGEVYTAIEFMKPILPMDSMNYQYKKSDFPFDENYYYNFLIYFQEPPAEGDYYQWELFLDNEHISDTLRTKTIESDELYNGSYIADLAIYQIPAYKIEQDTVFALLQMLSISKEKYDYCRAILLETDYSGGGFGGPPSNVPSNISNGALGFFSASAVSEIEMTIYKVNKDVKSKASGKYQKWIKNKPN